MKLKKPEEIKTIGERNGLILQFYRWGIPAKEIAGCLMLDDESIWGKKTMAVKSMTNMIYEYKILYERMLNAINVLMEKK